MRAIETFIVASLLASKVTANTDGDANNEMCVGEKGDKVSGKAICSFCIASDKNMANLQGGDWSSGIYWIESKYLLRYIMTLE